MHIIVTVTILWVSNVHVSKMFSSVEKQVYVFAIYLHYNPLMRSYRNSFVEIPPDILLKI